MKPIISSKVIFVMLRVIINFSFWLFLIVLAVLICYGGYLLLTDSPLKSITQNYKLEWLSHGFISDFKNKTEDLSIRSNTNYSLRVNNESPYAIILNVASLIYFTIWLGVFWNLRAVVNSITLQNPFLMTNAKRLTWVGLLLLASQIIECLRDVFINHIVANDFPNKFSSHFNFSLGLDGEWFWALIVLAIAQIYRQGVELYEEQKLTI